MPRVVVEPLTDCLYCRQYLGPVEHPGNCPRCGSAYDPTMLLWPCFSVRGRTLLIWLGLSAVAIGWLWLDVVSPGPINLIPLAILWFTLSILVYALLSLRYRAYRVIFEVGGMRLLRRRKTKWLIPWEQIGSARMNRTLGGVDVLSPEETRLVRLPPSAIGPTGFHKPLANFITALAAGVTLEPSCGGCGYDLRGLSRPRCPECGAVFSPGLLANIKVENASGKFPEGAAETSQHTRDDPNPDPERR